MRTRCTVRSSGPLRAVQTLCQDSRHGRLAHAPRTTEQIRMPRAVQLDRILKNLNDRLLADNFTEDLRAELSRYDLVFHRWVRHGGYCVTLDDLLPLLPSGPGGVCGVQLHSPPLPDKELSLTEKGNGEILKLVSWSSGQPDIGTLDMGQGTIDSCRSRRGRLRRCRARSPPQQRRGGCAGKKKLRSILARADGVVLVKNFPDQPPRPLPQRMLRDIFLKVASAPPLLRRGYALWFKVTSFELD